MSDGSVVGIRVDETSPQGRAWVRTVGGSFDGTGSTASWFPTPYVDLANGITESAAVQYASVHTFGRTESYKTFVGVDNREVTLLFHYIAEGNNLSSSGRATLTGGAGAFNGFNPNITQVPNRSSQTSADILAAANFATQASPAAASAIAGDILTSVVRPALWLENLKYPTTDKEGLFFAPPPLFLVIGSMLSMRCIVTSAQIRWMGPWLSVAPSTGRSNQELLPMAADVQMTFTSVSKNPSGARGMSDYATRPGFGS